MTYCPGRVARAIILMFALITNARAQSTNWMTEKGGTYSLNTKPQCLSFGNYIHDSRHQFSVERPQTGHVTAPRGAVGSG